jgi:transposase-like protein
VNPYFLTAAEIQTLNNLEVDIKFSGEMDEFWSFVQNKSNQRWTWYAIERKSGCILAWHNGKRQDKDFLVLWDLLKIFDIDKYHTDDWAAYSKYIPPNHKVKFPLVKAFYIVYFVATSKKGIASTELSRKLGLGQKTCWYFKRKVMQAMKISDNYPLTGKVDVDEFFVGGQEEGKKGRGKENKKLVVLAIEKRDRGISRMYGKVIERADSKSLGSFMRAKIEPQADIKTDKWTGYRPLQNEFKNPVQLDSGSKGGNFPQMHRAIMMFKSWLRGIYHRVTDLQAYIDEYTYRFNRHLMKDPIFDNLISRMINNKPYYLYD